MNRCDLFLFVVNAMYMGGQEMRTVMERDNITIEKNIDKVGKASTYLPAPHSIPLIT